MTELINWIENNVSQGVDISEAKKIVESYTIDSKEKALNMLNSNEHFKSVMDSAVSKAINSHDDNFKANKLPELIKTEREKLIAELNPAETSEQKMIREMQETINAMKAEKEAISKAESLRAKAKELGFDPDIASKFSVFGDSAEEMIDTLSKYTKSFADNTKQQFINEKMGGVTPPAADVPKGKTMSRDNFNALGHSERAAFFRDGGQLTD